MQFLLTSPTLLNLDINGYKYNCTFLGYLNWKFHDFKDGKNDLCQFVLYIYIILLVWIYIQYHQTLTQICNRNIDMLKTNTVKYLFFLITCIKCHYFIFNVNLNDTAYFRRPLLLKLSFSLFMPICVQYLLPR